jgi:hypothetical protein
MLVKQGLVLYAMHASFERPSLSRMWEAPHALFEGMLESRPDDLAPGIYT